MSTKFIITINNKDEAYEICPLTVEKDILGIDDFMNSENFDFLLLNGCRK